ncbi:MAG: Asp-tRNA(Asn)/Glu-tRNA(Gln) amidotransferase GatCAB subunit A, partial [Deltaproteobacteria bacterium]
MELFEMSAVQLLALMKKGEVSSSEITESVLKNIQQKESEIKAFITITPELAMKLAKEADLRIKKGEHVGKLNGIPVAIKDVLCTKGIRTTCASKILSGYNPPYNATLVQKLLDEGAVIVGKTNMDEFAMGSSTENSAFGPTRNPVANDRVPGGSSGGSAAAVAAGETIIAVGTDTGGSIRQPASFCGVVGMKPTYGRVSRYGLIAYASSLDQAGPFARCVEDCALLLNVISGHDLKDTTSAPKPVPDYLGSIKNGIKGFKIGLPKEYFVEGLDTRIKDKIMEAVAVLEKEGAEIMEISLPHTPYAVATYYLIATAEASSNLARYDGVKYGFRANGDIPDMIRMYEETRYQGFGKEVKRRIMLGTYVLSAGYYEAYYLKALKVRTLIRQDFDQAFQQVDSIITPVSPCLPFRLGEKVGDPLQMYLVDIYTVSLNLTGLPGISVPCGTVDSLPVGMQ